MSELKPIVRLYFAPLSYPCGPQSSCCGAVGQSEEDVSSWKVLIESKLTGVQVDAIDVTRPLRLGRDDAVLRLLRTFGQQAFPVFTLNGEVLSVGPPNVDELLAIMTGRIGTSSVEA
ncbi:MAG: hypothetical protein HYX75_13455 [Acidobacteria bacterium]|nr:hypothetical protein [Acidobacteriota bacterium]